MSEYNNIYLIIVDGLSGEYFKELYESHDKDVEALVSMGTYFSDAYTVGQPTVASIPAIQSSTYPSLFNDRLVNFRKKVSPYRVALSIYLKKLGYHTVALSSGNFKAYCMASGFDMICDQKEYYAKKGETTCKNKKNHLLFRLKQILTNLYESTLYVLESGGSIRRIMIYHPSMFILQLFRYIILERIFKNKQILNRDWVPFKSLLDECLRITTGYEKNYVLMHVSEVHNYTYFNNYITDNCIESFKKFFLNEFREITTLINPKYFSQLYQYYSKKSYLISAKYVLRQILLFIKDNGLNNNLFIITADHGWGFETGKINAVFYEAYMLNSHLSVPLLIIGDKIKKQIVKTQVSNLDIVPTIMDCIEKKIPLTFQGMSLKKYLKGTEYYYQEMQRILISEQINTYGELGVNCITAVKNDKYKVVDFGKGEVKCYKLMKNSEVIIENDTNKYLNDLIDLIDSHKREMKRLQLRHKLKRHKEVHRYEK